MLKFFKLFWRAISALLLFLGILWFPKDLLDTSEALKPWRDIIDMVEIDQLTAFKILAGFLTLWIVWIDLRPFFSRFKEKKWPKELTKPKFEFFFDVISFGWEDNLFVIDCTIKNVGVPAEVRAKISSHGGVWKAPGPSASKPVPASWRYGNQPSQALIKNQTESIRAFIVNKKNKTISIPYVSEKGKIEYRRGALVEKGDVFRAIVQLDILSNPESMDGSLTKFMVADLTLTDDETRMDGKISDDLKVFTELGMWGSKIVHAKDESQLPQLLRSTAIEKRMKTLRD